ncbi:MAG: DUF1610 domain-containing protein [Candidatus Aenigmatarchaeota archaeon]|nr:MAG: DUF1610 domain-containing protein [Candidatus Aenigmarchaeota archaeon]
MQSTAQDTMCTTCGKSVFGASQSVRFLCPRCGAAEIVRCKDCRVLKNKYACGCGFTGP